MQGWECPTCKTSYAPWVKSCDCVRRASTDVFFRCTCGTSLTCPMHSIPWGANFTVTIATPETIWSTA